MSRWPHPFGGQPRADLVLEGGGVKGVALVGAVEQLVEAGYRIERVAGTSAGAITGSVIAALSVRGEPLTRLTDIAKTLDFERLRDRGPIARTLGPLGGIADLANVLRTGGMYSGDYLHDWMRGVLTDLGVTTFADLRRHDPHTAHTPQHDYAFVAVTSDLSERRLTFLPWDYPRFGLDPDAAVVADAVRASASLPFIFRPARLATPHGEATLVDGGILSNYPIRIFDVDDRAAARWPTIGIRLEARERPGRRTRAVHGPIRLAVAVVETAMDGWDARNIEDPRVQDWTVFVNTGDLSWLDFDIDQRARGALREAGREAVRRWLAVQ